MKFVKTPFAGVYVIEPGWIEDERGFFAEWYNKKDFESVGIRDLFIQDNHSGSSKGVLRGLHYQCGPKAQGKLVRVVSGEIFDVVVDIRLDSPTFGQWLSETLSAENKKMIYVPTGFAHGFCATQDDTQVLYKVTEFYSPQHERGIRWNDPQLKIRWPDLGREYAISAKDRENPTWETVLKRLDGEGGP